MLTGSFAALATSLAQFGRPLFSRVTNNSKELRELKRIQTIFQESEERLLSGLILTPGDWQLLENAPYPWGRSVVFLLKTLRARGGSLLPSLKRLKQLSAEQHELLVDATGLSAQAWIQGVVCLALIPIFSFTFYGILPALNSHRMEWVMVTAISFTLGMLSLQWILRLTDEARWGALKPSEREWMLITLLSAERFLSLLRSGEPPDLSWKAMLDGTAEEAPELAQAWGHALWSEPAYDARRFSRTAELFVRFAGEIRKSVQVSLMEGTACGARIEIQIDLLKQELKGRFQAELKQLPTKLLKPLFFCVAPGLLLLLMSALALALFDAVA